MIYLSELNVGQICTVKKTYVIENGISEDFTKEGNRPFVIAEIKEHGIIWLVPSYSHCAEYSQKTKDFYFTTTTPSGNIKFLNYRNMIPIDCNNINSLYTPSQNTINNLTGADLRNFLIKYKSNKKYLKKFPDKAMALYKNPFVLEKKLMVNFLRKPYYWLERDFNIVNIRRHFNAIEEYAKSDFADKLYYLYQMNLKQFLCARNEYIPIRADFLKSQFNKEKVVTRYICYTENGFVSNTKPLEYSESITEAILVEEEILRSIPISCDSEPRITTVPMLDKKDKEHAIKELIYLEHNIVSEKTYYEIYKRTPNKREINDYIRNHSF